MKKVLVVLLIAVVAVAAWFLAPRFMDKPVEPPPVPETMAEAEPPPEPEVRPTEPEVATPMTQAEPYESAPAEPPPEPLPALSDSDPVVRETVQEVTGGVAPNEVQLRDSIVPRLVAAVDALTGNQVPGSLLPVEAPPTPFQANVDFQPPTVVTNAQGDELEQYTLDPVNFARYEPYVDYLESIDAGQFAAEYLHYNPLLQQAYAELGYPDGDFTARLLEVIDHLLATPQPEGPVRLVKPEAYYEFVDPELEALSAGQKLLIRMGGDNAERVRRKLVELRTVLGG
ncbi:DUF3014 domain-containing protein [Elongatibacter sediminis]|uniref:DUF3014 domain-containing protein n=1 Tax=Elongatibacter sediminis TaxID=3119006 RepID=A0AAW9R702_9GAMM